MSSIRLLVYTGVADYRHDSIPAGAACFHYLAEKNAWNLTITNEKFWLSSDVLASTDCVVFLNTSGDLFNENERIIFQSYIRAGGGFFGVHSGGTFTETSWPWFYEMVGAKFIGHPPVCESKIVVENHNHAATHFIGKDFFLWTDEVYSFDRNPRKDVTVLLRVDESSYDTTDNPYFGGDDLAMGKDHPLAWCREFEGGRIIQTALGHTDECFEHPLFQQHLEGAILWASSNEQNIPNRQ